MIAWSRTASFAATNHVSALKFAHEVAAHLTQLLGVDVRVSVPVGGDPMRVRWTAEYAGLAELGQALTKIANDPQYLQMLTQLGDTFIRGSGIDEFWQSA